MKLKLIAVAAGTMLLLTSLNVGMAKAQADVFPVLDGLELTQDQQTQLSELRQQVRTEAEGILTSEQRDQLRTALVEQQGLRDAIANLDLTEEQREQLRQTFQSARTEFSSILTPEQQQQLRSNIRTRIQER